MQLSEFLDRLADDLVRLSELDEDEQVSAELARLAKSVEDRGRIEWEESEPV